MVQRARSLDLPESVEIAVDGRPVTIAVRRSSRARRYTLRLGHGTGEPLLVIPYRGNLERGLAFAHSQADWLSERMQHVPGPVHFADGAVIPLRGKAHLLRWTGTLRGTVEANGRDRITGLPQI